MKKYNLLEIKKAYKKLGIKKGMTVVVKTDIRFLGPYKSNNQNEILNDHFKALSDLIDLEKGTIVVSAASTSLCNTDIPFDLNKTKSEMGSLTEYIRNKKGTKRSFHPFNSYAAIGKNSSFICDYFNRHSVGPNTPEARLIDLDAKYLSIGLHPKETSTIIHHIEKTAGVPYRYIKEFTHPVVRGNKIIKEPFYLNVRYRKSNVKMDLGRKVYPHFKKNGYIVTSEKLGRGRVYLFSSREFYKSTLDLLEKDLYACLTNVPKIKPYKI